LEFVDQDIVRILSDIMLENQSLLLSRDIFELTTEEFGEDFIQDEMNLYNNTKINYQFDRKMTFQEIKSNLFNLIFKIFKKFLKRRKFM